MTTTASHADSRQQPRATRRRTLAASLAVMLLAATFAAIAANPAQAANTSAEYLVDTDNDTVDDSRAFAGSNRYETSRLLATAYADEIGGLGAVSSVIIASGETLIDAVTSASLAAVNSAPVLLTGSRTLHQTVARYINDHGVTEVYVVGGPNSIPEAVVNQIRALESQPEVTRLAGPDREATAAAIADELFSPAPWCGTDGPAAILANGDMPASDAIAAGPLSYALQMPILLTDADSLSDSTADYLSDAGSNQSELERIVIVGDTSAVSEAVETEIEALGYLTERIGGDGLDTSVELTKLITTGDCQSDVAGATDLVALMNAEATADGVSAAPVLGSGFSGSGPIPILLTGNTLPDRVASYLRSTPTETGTAPNVAKTHLRIVAIGGTAVVSNSVVEAAISAAASGESLGATIVSASNVDISGTLTGQVVLEFSDEINLNDVGLTAVQRMTAEDSFKDLLYINGIPASVKSTTAGVGDFDITEEVSTASQATCGSVYRFKVNLTHTLRPGDVVTVRPTSAQFGTGGDRRLLEADSYTVPTARTNTAAPSVEIVAIASSRTHRYAGQGNRIYLIVSGADPDSPPTAAGLKTRLTVNSVSSGGDTEVIVEPATRSTVGALQLRPYGERIYTFVARNKTGNTPYYLQPRDVVTLSSNSILNSSDIGNRAIRATVREHVESPRVISVRMSNVDAGFAGNSDRAPGDTKSYDNSASNTITTVSNASWSVPGVTEVRVTARWTGDASGAAGNAWSITSDKAFGHDPDEENAEIEVALDARSKIIRIRYMDGTPTRAELVRALNSHAEFAELFEATNSDCNAAGSDLPVAANDLSVIGSTRPAADGRQGRSSVAFEVTFSDFVRQQASGGVLYTRAVLESLLPDFDSDAAAANNGGGDAPTAAAFNEGSKITSRFLMDNTGGLSKRAFIRYTTTNPAKLPTTRSGTGRGVITFTGDTDGTEDDGTVLFMGYADDDPDTTDINENDNEPSTPRITIDRNLQIID